MKDKDNKTTDNTENGKEQEQESKSIIQKRKEMYEKADEEERIRRENVQKRYKERKRRAAEAHDKRLEEEHIELLKLKSGLISESDVLKQSIAENESYIKGETQADAIVWKNSTAGLQETDADGEKVAVEAVRA